VALRSSFLHYRHGLFGPRSKTLAIDIAVDDPFVSLLQGTLDSQWLPSFISVGVEVTKRKPVTVEYKIPLPHGQHDEKQ